MSVMNKMLSTEQYLEKIYNNTKKELFSQIDARSDEAQAKKLEIFLRQIKYMQQQFSKGQNLNFDNFPFATFWSKMEQIKMMSDLYQINKEIFQKGTFIDSFTDMENQKSLLGSSLEEGVARVIRTFADKVGNKGNGEIHSIVGGRHTQIPDLNNIVNEEIKSQFTQYYWEIQNKMNESNTNKDYIPSVQGKIDNVGLSAEFVLSVSGDIKSKMDKDILFALSNATFTDKNYITTSHLNLGQTNPFRVFATVAANMGEPITERYQRMIKCFENHNEHLQNQTTFYRIRAIYELTGVKMQYTEKSIQESSAVRQIAEGRAAKFLIWNNPVGDIRVIPTRLIVNNLIDSALLIEPKDWREALYGPIQLSQKDL